MELSLNNVPKQNQCLRHSFRWNIIFPFTGLPERKKYLWTYKATVPYKRRMEVGNQEPSYFFLKTMKTCDRPRVGISLSSPLFKKKMKKKGIRKGYLFWKKWYIKGQGVGPRGGASPYKTLLRTPIPGTTWHKDILNMTWILSELFFSL